MKGSLQDWEIGYKCPPACFGKSSETSVWKVGKRGERSKIQNSKIQNSKCCFARNDGGASLRYQRE